MLFVILKIFLPCTESTQCSRLWLYHDQLKCKQFIEMCFLLTIFAMVLFGAIHSNHKTFNYNNSK